jgi:hypothetical protein
MKKTLAILAATTALTAVIGVPAYSSFLSPVSGEGNLAHLLSESGREPARLRLASSGDDDDRRYYKHSRRDDDDHHRRGDDHDDDDDDDHGNYSGRANPAPAGTVAPPKNGLFGNGAPKVQVN